MSYSVTFPSQNRLDKTTIQLQIGEIIVMKDILEDKASVILKSLFYGKPIKEAQLYMNEHHVIPSHQVEKQRVAYMPPHSFTMADLTVIENVSMWFSDPSDLDAILYEPLLQPVIHTKVGKISGGERRFLETLLMVQLPHELLLLDQPLRSLAPLSAERVIEKLKAIKSTKAILINDYYLSVNSHDFHS
jgi:ABC-type branched-subunit amino acid transport system ATPase component